MKTPVALYLPLILISCLSCGVSGSEWHSVEKAEPGDTIRHFWPVDNSIYTFDTTINGIIYQMRTYCLNDSAVYNEVSAGERKTNKGVVEFDVAHNFASDVTIIKGGGEIELHLVKESFKGSLSSDFLRICHMWKNGFSQLKDGKPVFQAVFAKPDTDDQCSIFYQITDSGKLKILKVENDSYEDPKNE
jgi:hypothetical protein